MSSRIIQLPEHAETNESCFAWNRVRTGVIMAAAGAEPLCTKDDRKLWDKSAHLAFSEDMNACAPGCMGGAKCTAACAAKRQPLLSESCMRAYGDIAQCTARRCWSQCIGGGSSPKCEGCVVSSCNPAFFATTGLSEAFAGGRSERESGGKGSPPPPGDVCTKADKVLWEKKAHLAFDEDMNACAPGCMGGAKCTAACAAKRQPLLSESCVRAYGDIAQCTARRCWSQCIGGKGPKCEGCVVSSCNPAFFATTGLKEMPAKRGVKQIPVNSVAAESGSGSWPGAVGVVSMLLALALLVFAGYRFLWPRWRVRVRRQLYGAKWKARSSCRSSDLPCFCGDDACNGCTGGGNVGAAGCAHRTASDERNRSSSVCLSL